MTLHSPVNTVQHGGQSKSLWHRNYGRRGIELSVKPLFCFYSISDIRETVEDTVLFVIINSNLVYMIFLKG